MPNPMAMESAPLMTTEAESRREKAMPQASSSTDDPAPVSAPEASCSASELRSDPSGASKSSVPVEPSRAAMTRVGVACSGRMSLVSRTLATSSKSPYTRMDTK